MINKINFRQSYPIGIGNSIEKNELKLPVSILQECKKIPQLVMVTTFPPRECGIATFAQDLIKAVNDKFTNSFDIKVCALENGIHQYGKDVNYTLETNKKESYLQFADKVNSVDEIKLVIIQHEFGLFRGNENDFLQMVTNIKKEVLVVFHTVLPKPEKETQIL